MDKEMRLYDIQRMEDIPTKGKAMFIMQLKDAETGQEFDEVKFWPPSFEGFSYDELWNNGDPELIEGHIGESYYNGKKQLVFNTKEQLKAGGKGAGSKAKARTSPGSKPKEPFASISVPPVSPRITAMNMFSKNPQQWMETTGSKNVADCVVLIQSMLEE